MSGTETARVCTSLVLKEEAIGLCARYAMSSTEVARVGCYCYAAVPRRYYAAMLQLRCYALSGTAFA
eukprot:2735751-Rhodomonas_salina.2